MRERSTWNLHEVARKATSRRAAEVAGDIYTMNQDHPQPGWDEYVIGDPSDFAEDVHEPNTWEEEYSGGQTDRDEIGMAEMRKDTFNHAEKTAADKVRLKKAELCVAVAKLMLAGRKVASIDAIEDQAYALMYVPDQELINTHMRLAAEQEEDASEDDEEEDIEDVDEDADDDADEESEDGQQKQAGEIPPQFKENIEKMKAKSESKDEDDGDEEEEKGEQKKASSKSGGKKKSDAGLKEPKNEGGKQNSKANDNWPTKSANGQQIAQMQQMMAQLQAMLSEAQGEQGQQEIGQGQQQIGQGQMQQQIGQGEEDDLDQMLAGEGCGPMAEVDIEMEPAPMDVDQVVLAGDDEILRTLFAQEQEDDGGDEEAAPEQAQEKQARSRTASTRTVGTRPRDGVSKLGGAGSKTASTATVDALSSLWQSAPDVRDAFGLK